MHRWNVIEEYNLSPVNYDDPVDWVCEDLGIEEYWVAVGIKASDSPLRARAIAQHGAWTPSKQLFYHVADLKKAELLALFDKYKAPLSKDYLVFGRSFDGLQYRYVSKIKQHYPEDYKTILKWYPLVEAEFMRAEAFKSQPKAEGSL